MSAEKPAPPKGVISRGGTWAGAKNSFLFPCPRIRVRLENSLESGAAAPDGLVILEVIFVCSELFATSGSRLWN